MHRRLAPVLLVLLGFGPVPAVQAQPAEAIKAVPGIDEPRQTGHLDVTLVVFDPGLPENEAALRDSGIFPEIRKVEASYLPFVLRRTLVQSGNWGVVRVVPQPDATAELQITGTIVESDGVSLALSVRAVDSTGREWLNAVFEESSMQYDNRYAEPFSAIYTDIADALLAARQQLDARQLDKIVEVSTLRYAGELVPEAFGDYLSMRPDGSLDVRRLPSRDDPLMVRVQRVRQFETLFTDTIDEEFRLLQTEIADSYNLWCRYRRQMQEYQNSEKDRARNRTTNLRRGSFEAMRRHYDNFKWSKIQEQQLEQWAAGFNNEVEATVVDVDGRVVELTGDLDARYEEWRRILRSIFELETQSP